MHTCVHVCACMCVHAFACVCMCMHAVIALLIGLNGSQETLRYTARELNFDGNTDNLGKYRIPCGSAGHKCV